MTHLVGSAGYFTFLYGHKKYNRERGRKRTNEQYRLMSVPSARRGVLCDLAFLCICRLMLACILRETSTKRHQQCRHLLALVNRPLCCSSGLSSHLSDFCWLCYSLDSQLKADHSPLPCVVDFLSSFFFVYWPLSSLGPSFPPLRPVSSEISSSSPLFGFRAKTKWWSAWRTTHIVSQG